jgi:hypothetical protein
MKKHQRLSDHQRRIQLLAHLGWQPGKPLSEYAGAATTFWFGTRDGKRVPGANPMLVPIRVLAKFVVHYAPHTKLKIDRRTVVEIAREYRV